MSIMQAAITQADDRAQREGRSMVVYHVGRDRYGRLAVFYVRPEDGSEGWAPFDVLAQRGATVAYRAAVSRR